MLHSESRTPSPRLAWIAALGLSCASCAAESDHEPGDNKRGDLFVDATGALGLDALRHYAGFTQHRYLPETMGSGVGLLDYDLDGRLDLYLVNSAPLEGEPRPEPAPINRLFHGEPGKLSDVTAQTGVGDPSFGIGCAVADIDGDGDPDLYVLNYGANVLYRNGHDAGAPQFADTTEAAGVTNPGWSAAAGFIDTDRDGDLDLYVVDYLIYSEARQRQIFSQANTQLGAAYPHPDRFNAAPDHFYRNDGSGSFAEATAEVGLAVELPGKGLGVAFADVEGDGDPDIYVANDSTPNFLFLNDGSGAFEEVAAEVGCAYNLDGDSEASMGVQFGDVDSDGLPDLCMTHLDLETNTFYRNTSKPGFVEFRDLTRAAGLVRPSFRLTGFGMAFFDYDADGNLDLFIANGDLHPNAAEIRPGHSYKQPDKLLRGSGDGSFEDVSETVGPYFRGAEVSRGTAVGDIDNDGDPDLVISTSGGRWFVLENRATDGRHWLHVTLDGGSTEPTRGQGASISVKSGDRTQHRELWTSHGYASANEAAAFFGLGSAGAIEQVEVRWPSGALETWSDVKVDQRLVLRRGTGAAPGTDSSGVAQ